MLTGDTLSPILYGMTNAITYLRVSGADQNRGDGFERQRVACATHAASAGMEVVGEYIETVSGTHDGLDRPVFAAMLERIAGNGVRVVLIERADRLARDLMVSEALLCQLRNLGVKVIESCSGLDLTDASDPSRIMIRQMLGAVAASWRKRAGAFVTAVSAAMGESPSARAPAKLKRWSVWKPCAMRACRCDR